MFRNAHKPLLSLALSLCFCGALLASDPPVNQNWSGVAIKGYDPVAYFSVGQPTKGQSKLSYVWNGATWNFSSAANLELFKAAPEKYAPQFGGYCAWAVSQNSTANIDPSAWKIVAGKLYLNYNADIQKKWEKDMANLIKKGEQNWPAVLKN